MAEEQIRPDKRNDWREVRNYIEALNTSITELKTLPLSNRLLNQAHEILMRGYVANINNPVNFVPQ